MSKYRIVTEATSDLPQALVEELGIAVIPMECRMEEKVYMTDPSGRDLDPAFFYAKMREGVTATTSQINVLSFIECFTEQFQKGLDVIYFALSSTLTSRAAAYIAMEELQPQFPERRFIMVDSLCASLGLGLLVYTAAQMQKQGMEMDALAAWAEENKLKICHWFTVDDLKYLVRSGRLSTVSGMLGTALNIKPVLRVDDEGRLTPLEKVQGRRRSLKTLAEHIQEGFVPADNPVVFIGHADCAEDAAYVQKLIEENLHVTSFVVHYIGPVIGAHSGPGTVALFHFGAHR